MGWFWADTTPTAAAPAPPSDATTQHAGRSPPAGCPMHKSTVDVLSGKPQQKSSPPSSCPVPHDQKAPSACPGPHAQPADKPQSLLSQLNPLNYMFPDLTQDRAPGQTHALPTSREESSIPRSDGDTKWEYPSPQQMYNALLRKGYHDTDITAVEDMVAVHNFLNEGAWAEVVGWEQRFGGGLAKGFGVCKRGEENAEREIAAAGTTEPTLIRFQGRPKEMTPKAAMMQMLGRVYPSKFATEPPFDRHDWYVSRNINGQNKEVRYVIDYYSGEPEPTGEPVFYLDVRPAMTATGAAERAIRWATDVWWRASGGVVREAAANEKENK